MSRTRYRLPFECLPACDFMEKASSPVLSWEDGEEFARLRRALQDEIKPQGFVETMYTLDAVWVLWELYRARRVKQEKINRAYQQKLQAAIHRAFANDPAKLAAMQAFADPAVSDEDGQDLWEELSRTIDLAALEMSVMEDLSDRLQQLDRGMAAAETRRDKFIARIAQYRKSFAKKMEQSIDAAIAAAPGAQVQDGKDRPQTKAN